MPADVWGAMRKRSLPSFVVSCGVLALIAGCGTSTPAGPTTSPTPVATPTPTPAPVATPTPSPTPEPCTQGLCEEPVTNTNPARRVTIRLYVVEDPGGGYISDPSPDNVPVGFTARLDVTSKDVDNRETEGQGPVEFFFSNPGMIEVSGNHTNQRRVVAKGPGQLDCWAVQDGTRSNILTLTFNN